MDGHWVVLFIVQLIYTLPIIVAIVGAIHLLLSVGALSFPFYLCLALFPY